MDKYNSAHHPFIGSILFSFFPFMFVFQVIGQVADTVVHFASRTRIGGTSTSTSTETGDTTVQSETQTFQYQPESWLRWSTRLVCSAILQLWSQSVHRVPWIIDDIILPPTILPLTLLEMYETKYADKLAKISSSSSSSSRILSNNIVMELTPRGWVAMRYDSDRSAFTYYANNSIPTNLLHTVARKFAVQFHAPHLMEHAPIPDVATESSGKDKTSKTGTGLHSGKNSAMFAKFTQTKTDVKKGTVTSTSSTITTTSPPKVTVNVGPRFIRIGRMSDLVVLRNTPTKNTDNISDTEDEMGEGETTSAPAPAPAPRSVHKNVSFAEYKKQQQLLQVSI